MMEMLKALFPVLGMMGIGMFCRKSGAISEKGIQDLKTLMTQIILPIAVFHALATAEYTPQLFTLVGLMLVFMILPFLLGYPLRRVIPQPYSRYTPFMVAVYEGGLSPVCQPVRQREPLPDRPAGHCRRTLWLRRIHEPALPDGERQGPFFPADRYGCAAHARLRGRHAGYSGRRHRPGSMASGHRRRRWWRTASCRKRRCSPPASRQSRCAPCSRL